MSMTEESLHEIISKLEKEYVNSPRRFSDNKRYILIEDDLIRDAYNALVEYQKKIIWEK